MSNQNGSRTPSTPSHAAFRLAMLKLTSAAIHSPMIDALADGVDSDAAARLVNELCSVLFPPFDVES